MVAIARAWILCTETGLSLYKMISEFLKGRFCEHSLFRGQGWDSWGLRGGIKGDLGEVAQGGSAAPG